MSTQLLFNQKEQIDTMLQSLERIASLLRLYKIMEDLYIDKQPADLSERNLSLERAVIKLYTQILGFQARLVAHLWKGSLHRGARNIVKADDWKSWLDEIEKSNADCLLYTDLIDKDGERRAWEKQYLQSDDQLRLQASIVEALNSARREREADRNEGRRERLLRSLSTDYEEQKNFNPKRAWDL